MRYFPRPLTREESDAAVDWARGLIDELGLDEIVAARGFDHPSVPDGPLRRHFLYYATGLPI